MAISLIQTKTGSSISSSTVAATWDSNVTTGNLIVVMVGHTTETVSSITDSQSNTYSAVDANYNFVSTNYVSLYYAKNITGGTTPTVTVTLSGGTGTRNIIIREYSGLDTVSPYDVTVHASGNNSVPSSGATATTAQADELVVGVNSQSTNSTQSAGSGYGNFVSAEAQIQCPAYAEDKIISATGAQTATFASTLFNWGCQVATFKAASTTLSVSVSDTITTSESANQTLVFNVGVIPTNSAYTINSVKII